MRAFAVPAPATPARMMEVGPPEVSEDTVLIRVLAAGLNPVDNAIARGDFASTMAHIYPVVLGRDCAGVVEQVGDGVRHVAPGELVIGALPLVSPLGAGTLGEWVLVPADAVFALPQGLDPVHGAALPTAGTAAARAVDIVDVQPAQVVLIHGATGGVGSYAVQLAAQRGAVVLATGGGDDIPRLATLGAAQVYDRAYGPVVEQVRADYPQGIDALIELVARAPGVSPLAAVRRGGVVATTTGTPDAEAIAAAGLTGEMVDAGPRARRVRPLAELAAAGKLRVDVSLALPFERAGEGLAVLAEGHTRGKIVVRVAGRAVD